MFHSFLSPKKKKPTKLRDEEELLRLRMNDDYDRIKSLKDFFTILIKIVTVLFVIALCIEYTRNQSFRDFMVNSVEQNISGIIFFILSIAGISFINKKD